MLCSLLVSLDFVSEIWQSLLNLAFPKHNHMPACGLKFGVLLPVTCHVPVELGLPELHIGLRRGSRFTAFVPMPKAAIHEDDRVPLGKHNVGMSRQLWRMEAKAESQGVEVTAHKHLRLRVLRSNPAHRVATLLWGNLIRERKN